MVTILARINVDGAYPFVKPVWTGRKLKPGRVILNGVETQRDDIRYYLRYSAGGKQVTEPAGVHPLDAVTKRDKKESLLRTEAARGAVSSPVLQIVAQRASEGDSTPLETAVETYLEGLRDTSLHPDLKPHTIAGYAHTLGQFKSHCHKSLEGITREDGNGCLRWSRWRGSSWSVSPNEVQPVTTLAQLI